MKHAVYTEVSDKSSTSTIRFNEAREQGRCLVLSRSGKSLFYYPRGSGGSFIIVVNKTNNLQIT